MDSSGIAFTIAIATVILLFYLAYNVFNKSENSDKTPEPVDQGEAKKEEKPIPSKAKETKKQAKPVKTKEPQFKHTWLSGTLKAHSDKLTGIDFSSNGKYLLSSGLDRAIYLWSTKEFQSQQPKNVRCNVEFDHAVQVRFSPDSKSFIAGLGVANTIRAFKITKKDDTANLQMVQAAIPDFPKAHKADLINIGISCTAKFIMSCSSDTSINIWDVKGEKLGSIDTKMMNNSFASVSSCGRFFGACGFTPEVRIWEVCFDKAGQFKEIKSAFQLSHSAGVYNFSFNADSTKVVSVSKDLTWKLWNTKIDYERGQDADLLLTGHLKEQGPSMVALSPDSYTIAVVTNKTLRFFNALTAECDEVIENVCNEKVCEILFSSDNKYLAVACDKHVKVFHNITGHKVAIQALKKELVSARTEGAKQRIEQLIDGHYDAIQAADGSQE